jgi:hypothetical protein
MAGRRIRMKKYRRSEKDAPAQTFKKPIAEQRVKIKFSDMRGEFDFSRAKAAEK